MFFRGGLLIEPWKAYHYYTSNPKEQSIVSFEDALYVCNTAHQSGATFAENASKFISAGSGGVGGVGGVYLGDLDLTPPYSLSPDAKNGDVFRCSVAGNFAGLPMEVGDLGTLIFDGASCLITPCYTVIGTMINDALSTAISNTITENIANAITASVEANGEVDLAITDKIADNREKQIQIINLTTADDGSTQYISADDGNGGRILYPLTQLITSSSDHINTLTIVVDDIVSRTVFKEGDVFSIMIDTSTNGGQIDLLTITGLTGFNPINISVPTGVELYLSFAVVSLGWENSVVFIGTNIDLVSTQLVPPAAAVTTSQILNPVNNTTVPLPSNEVSILINDSVARDEQIFSISDEGLFIGDTPIRVTVETNATITNLRFDFGGSSSPIEQTISANQKMIFVFQRRGDFKELMSRTVL